MIYSNENQKTIAQIVPQTYGNQLGEFQKHQSNLLERVSWYTGETLRNGSQLNPYPLMIPASQLQAQDKLQKVLSKAIKAVVEHYFDDQRIRQIVRLPERAVQLLQQASQRDYQIGSYRPDFLYDTEGEIVVCEINARFPTNGFFLWQYLKECSGAYVSGLIGSTNDAQPTCGANCITPFLQRASNGATKANTTYIVKGREVGCGIHMLLHEFNKQGMNCHLISGQDLRRVLDTDKSASFILELHQDEILAPETFVQLSEICRTRNYFNDLRTIFIVHDKRMLAVFHRQDIMRDYLSADECAYLARHVAATSTAASDPAAFSRAVADRQSWLIKPSQFGKGEGIVIGNRVEKSEWIEHLKQAVAQDCVLQKVVDQPSIEIQTVVAEELHSVPMRVVGSLLCFDDTFFGPGIYRASEREVINVATGASMLFHVLDAESAGMRSKSLQAA